MHNKISIIVPVYNVEKYLDRCINSLLNQTYENIEVLLIDDCSTDNSARICKDYQDKYSDTCKYLCNKSNSGAGVSRNTGLSNATGDWIVFLDSDDWLHEKYVELLLEDALKNNSDIVMCGYYYAWDDGRQKNMTSFNGITNDSSQKEKISLIPQPSVTRRLYRFDFVKQAGILFPTIRRLEDAVFAIPLLTMTKKISIINTPLYFYYQRNDSSSNSNSKNMDFTFLHNAIALVWKCSKKGFEEELEYRSLLEIIYGKTIVMIDAGFSRKEITQVINDFKTIYPHADKNNYLHDNRNRIRNLYMIQALKGRYYIIKLLNYLKKKVY